MPVWATAVTAVAAARVATAAVFYLSGQVDATGPSPVPLWVYALLSVSFAAVGGMLVVGHNRDARARWLGGALVLFAVPLAERLLVPGLSPTPAILARLRPDTFLSAFLWYFVVAFPSPLTRRIGLAARAVAAMLVLLGVAAFAGTLSTAVWPLTHAADPRAWLLPGTRPGSVYWPVTFLAGLAAMAVLAWRFVTSGGGDRFRLGVFIGGLVAGLSPLFVEVIVEESWPAYKALVHRPDVEPWMAAVLFVPMAAVPFVVAYSALYDRVVETRVALRAAAQYFLAKITIISFAAVPFAALTLFLYERRTESLVALVAGPRPIALGSMVVAGAVMLRLRRRWQRALDRRYFREQHDTQVLLTHLMSGDWITQPPAGIADTLARELDAAFHARADLHVTDPAPGELRNPRADGPALSLRGTLATLLMSSAQPMDVATAPGTPLSRLPEVEQQWLAAGPYVLLIPLRARSAELVGVLALGAKRSELPYDDSDRRALLALSAHVALGLDNSRLRRAPESQTPPPASECLSCARLHAGTTKACACGGAVTEAPAPYLLRGVFQFERRLGAGGMGVVYLARDLQLGRQVAIKTLPVMASRHQARLRSEAQAMASIVDGNLAVVYGIEEWRDVPFLVEEYLEGGTLADRLTSGPLDVSAALDLGVTLAAALARLHDAGIVHCDIKPSNIGFTRGGTPKLIDFGLAHLLRSTGHALPPTAGSSAATVTVSTVTDRGVVGTPAYMSPEALSATAPLPSFDQWALAVVLFEAIAGRRPFLGRDFTEVSLAILAGRLPDLRELRPECGPAIAELLARCLSREPGERPTDAAAFHRQLLGLRAAGA